MSKDRPSSSRPNERLKQERLLRGWTQADLAGQVGTDGYTVHRWESGRTRPGPYFRRKLCDLFGKSTLELGLVSSPPESPLAIVPAVPLSASSALAFHWHVPHLRNPFFTGREKILEALHASLRADRTVALTQAYALHGLGGIGKTQIALEYAYRHARDYHAVFWIEAETMESIATSMIHIAECLQLPEGKEPDQRRIVAAVRRWLMTQSQWLLIWDNVKDLDLLTRSLPPALQGAVLITTRCQTLGTLAQSLALQPMTPEEGVVFVLRRAKILGEETTSEQMQLVTQRLPHEYAAAEELVQVMGGLPLALDQAGAYMEETRCGVSQYLHLFEQYGTQLLGRRGMPGSNHPHSVATTFFLAYTQIKRRNPLAAAMLRQCTFLAPDAIPEELLTALIQETGSEPGSGREDSYQMNQAFAVLHAFSLVQRQVETRTVSIHRLVQAVLQQSMSEQERAEARQRVLHGLHALFPEPYFAVRDQSERLLPHVLTCLAALPDYPDDVVLVELLERAADYLRERERHAPSEQLYQRALGLLEQTSEPNHPLLARILHGLALLSSQQGKQEQARPLYERALHLREQAFGPNHALVAQSLNVLGNSYTEQGQYEQAEPLYRRALGIREQAFGPQHLLVASPLNNLAELSYHQGKYEQAGVLYKRALQIWTTTLGPDAVLRWYALHGLADLFQEQGKDEEAEASYWQALSLLEQAGGPDDLYVAFPLGGLAAIACKQGRYEEAEALYQRALALRERYLGQDHPETARTLNGLAHLAVQQGQDAQAETLYRRALSIREQRLPACHPDTARSLAGLARLYLKQEEADQAEPLMQSAALIFEQRLGQTHPETVKARNDLARLREQRGEERSEAHDGWPTQEAASSTLSIHPEQTTRSPLIVTVRGRREQVVYTRTIPLREVTLTCTLCGQTVTQFHYPSGHIKYCSDECRALRRAQMQEERVRKQREKRRAVRERNHAQQ